MHKKLSAIGFIVAIALAATAFAQSGGAMVGTAPGKAGAVQTLKATATITAIDKATRDVTLTGPQGYVLTVTAGPDVRNFDNLNVGEQVDIQYLEALTLELKKGGGLVVGRTEEVGKVGAEPGEMPGGAVGRRVTIIANVVATDAATQTVTLKGPQRTVDLRIPDPEQFKRIAQGDQVEAKYTQALALAVEPTKK